MQFSKHVELNESNGTGYKIVNDNDRKKKQKYVPFKRWNWNSGIDWHAALFNIWRKQHENEKFHWNKNISKKET